MTDGIGREFMLKTRYPFLSPSAESQGVPNPPLELPYPADAKMIELPAPSGLDFPAVELRTVMEKRRSLRRYSPQPLSLAELSGLLWLTQGVKRITERPVTLRTVPSAGARHAFETYLLCNRVEGLAPGLYRYSALKHALVEIDLSADVAARLTKSCCDQVHVLNSAVTFAWAAVVERMKWRYGERGYRYLLLDAGHACQNLYLAAEAIGCGVCAIAAFVDEDVDTVLGLDGAELFSIYLASLGKRA